MLPNKDNSSKRTINNNPKKPIDINLNALVEAVTNLRAQSTLAEEQLNLLQDDQSKIKSLLNAMGDQIWFCDPEGDVLYANTAAREWFQEELGKPFMNWRAKMSICTFEGIPCDPENAPLLRALHGEEIRGELERVKHPVTGEYVYHEINAIPVLDTQGKPMGAVANIRDVTLRYKAERQTQMLLELMVTLSEVSGVLTVAETTLDQCLRIFTATTGLLLLFSYDGLEARVLAQVGFPEKFNRTYPIIPEPPSTSVEATTSLELPSASETLQMLAVYCPDFYQELAGQFDLGMMFNLPLRANNKITGSVVISFQEAIRLSREDQVFYQLVASYCALALDRALLYEQSHTAALAQERQRFARDLHDSVTQSLYTAKMMSEVLLTQKETIQQALLWERIERLHRLTSGALAQMRNLLLEMRPEHWEMLSMEDVLHQVANAAMGNTLINVTVEMTETLPALPAKTQMAFYFIAQEAINNVIKHAKATQVWITLETRNDLVQLSITDNGQGFNPDPARRGMGLGNMRERAQEIGADFHIEKARHGGTQIRVSIHRA